MYPPPRAQGNQQQYVPSQGQAPAPNQGYQSRHHSQHPVQHVRYTTSPRSSSSHRSRHSPSRTHGHAAQQYQATNPRHLSSSMHVQRAESDSIITQNVSNKDRAQLASVASKASSIPKMSQQQRQLQMLQSIKASKSQEQLQKPKSHSSHHSHSHGHSHGRGQSATSPSSHKHESKSHKTTGGDSSRGGDESVNPMGEGQRSFRDLMDPVARARSDKLIADANIPSGSDLENIIRRCSEQYERYTKRVAKLNSQSHRKILQHIYELTEFEKRESALLALSRRRENFPDLAPLLWGTPGVIAALLQEVISVYPYLSGTVDMHSTHSNRCCNALALLQCVASHPETRGSFLTAYIPLFLYPFLSTRLHTRPFEYLRLTSLGVIGALVKHPHPNTSDSVAAVPDQSVTEFLVSTEAIPLCLQIMEYGNELSKTVATFIVQKILLEEQGLSYVCKTSERFFAVARVLKNIIELQTSPNNKPSKRLIKHVIRIYLRLCDDTRAHLALGQVYPNFLSSAKVEEMFADDEACLIWLRKLQDKLKESGNMDPKQPSSRNIPNRAHVPPSASQMPGRSSSSGMMSTGNMPPSSQGPHMQRSHSHGHGHMGHSRSRHGHAHASQSSQSKMSRHGHMPRGHPMASHGHMPPSGAPPGPPAAGGAPPPQPPPGPASQVPPPSSHGYSSSRGHGNMPPHMYPNVRKHHHSHGNYLSPTSNQNSQMVTSPRNNTQSSKSQGSSSSASQGSSRHHRSHGRQHQPPNPHAPQFHPVNPNQQYHPSMSHQQHHPHSHGHVPMTQPHSQSQHPNAMYMRRGWNYDN